MVKQTTIALMIVRPGPLRQSLQTLLTTLPEIEIVAEARDTSALQATSLELQPDLILLEIELAANNIAPTLACIKEKWPCASCITLVDTAAQMRTAAAAGTDVALFKGYRAAELIKIIERLLAIKKVNDQSPC